jgi:hypothetical protein
MPVIGVRAAGPLPRQAFRSFLATAGDPSPNPGGGVVGAEFGALTRSSTSPRGFWGGASLSERRGRPARVPLRCTSSARTSPCHPSMEAA